MLQQLRAQTQDAGLDRRRYGRLRAHTDVMLDNVRAMNRLAVDARQGKMTQRLANAELDRLAEKIRTQVSDVRKTAGIPTPSVRPGAKNV